MATTPTQFFGDQLTATAGGASAQLLYTNPAATVSTITNVTITNNDSVARTVTIARVPNSGGAVGTEAQAYRFVNAMVVQPQRTIVVSDLRLVLGATNDTLKAFASVTSMINIFASGVVEI